MGGRARSATIRAMEPESPTNRAVWRIPGLVLLAAVAVGGFAVAASARHVEVAEKHQIFPAAKRLVLNTSSGTVVVHGEQRSDVDVSSRIRSTGHQPALQSEASGSLLRLRASCHHSFFDFEFGGDSFGIGPLCAANYTVSVPAAMSLSIDLGQGDIRGDGLASPTVSVDSGTGDVDLEFVTAPSRVTIDSGTGDVTLHVPGGSYALQLDTGTGDTHVDSGIVRDQSSPNAIRIGTGTGDVSIEQSDV
jgi:hypothetical protein